jgi:hypothetical protein
MTPRGEGCRHDDDGLDLLPPLTNPGEFPENTLGTHAKHAMTARLERHVKDPCVLCPTTAPPMKHTSATPTARATGAA